MPRINRTMVICAALLGAQLAGLALVAQAQNEPPNAPVPAQILAAKSLFVSNGGGDCNPLGNTAFSGPPDRPYNQFYLGMKGWGRYALVGAPANADLIFEIHFTCPLYFDEKTTKIDSQFRLVVLDPTTHAVLWAFTEHAQPALLKGNRDKNFDKAMADLIEDVKQLVVRPDALAPAKQ